MPLRNARAVTFSPRTLSDTVDATNQQPGCLLAAEDIVPSMHSKNVWVPRPASTKSFDFSTLGAKVLNGEALIEIGDRVYGWVATDRFSGNSEPFCYDFTTGAFRTISGLTAGNTPTSTPSTGDWTPPTIARVGGWVLLSHPGFKLPNAFGWLDETSLNDTATGDVGYGGTLEGGVWDVDLWDEFLWSGSTSPGGALIINLSKDVLNAGWRPGQTITDSGGAILPGTTITAISRDGLAIQLSQPTTTPVPVVGDTLTVKGGTPDQPLWAAGNVDLNPLVGIANSVAIFNGRAWYAVANATAFSDAGDPLVATNANQVITLQNGLAITAQSTIPFNNSTVAGGIVNALLLFQGDSGIWQVTGDQATTNLALNFLSPLGTLAPLTLAPCPLGTFFVAPDGVRLIQLDGTVSDPIATQGEGVALAFINATYPSRMCGAYNEDTYRISVSGESALGGSPIPDMISGEYWFNMRLKSWSGRHSFPAKLICPSDRPHTNHGFLLFPLGGINTGSGALETGGAGVLATGGGGVLLATAPGITQDLPEVWFSNTRPLIDSIYVENGNQMTWRYATSLLPNTLQMFQNMCVETTLFIALSPPGSYTLDHESLWDVMVWDQDDWDTTLTTTVPNPGQTATVNAYNEAGQLLAQAQINGFAPFANGTQLPAGPPSFWDTMVWDSSTWDTDPGGAIPTQRRVAWPRPLVFQQVIIEITSESSPRVAIGNLHLRYQQRGYMVQDYSTLAALGWPGAPPVNGATAP